MKRYQGLSPQVAAFAFFIMIPCLGCGGGSGSKNSSPYLAIALSTDRSTDVYAVNGSYVGIPSTGQSSTVAIYGSTPLAAPQVLNLSLGNTTGGTFALNQNGNIVGSLKVGSSSKAEYWDSFSSAPVPLTSSGSLTALAINSQKTILAQSGSSVLLYLTPTTTPINLGSVTTPHLSDSGAIAYLDAGSTYAQSSATSSPVLLTDGKGQSAATISEITPTGLVIGKDKAGLPAYWTGPTYNQIRYLFNFQGTAQSTVVTSSNAADKLGGYYEDQVGVQHACIWESPNAIPTDISHATNLPSVEIAKVKAIFNDGSLIVTDQGGDNSFYLIPN